MGRHRRWRGSDEAAQWLARQGNKEAAARYRAREKVLSDEEVRDRLKLTEHDLKKLQGIIDKPGRNAVASLGALKAKMLFTVPMPRQEISGDIGVQVVVNTLRRPVEDRTMLPGEVEGEDAE